MPEPHGNDPICALQERAWAERDAGRFGGAEGHLRRALELLDERGEGGHPDAANLRCELAGLLAGRRCDAEAERLAREALAILDSLVEGCSPDDLEPDVLEPLERIRMEALAQLATALRGQGRYGEAEAPCREALRRAVRLCGPRSLEAAGKLNDLGVLSKYAGRLGRAARAYGRAKAVLERSPHADPALLATLTYNLSGLAHARGDFEAAEPLAREALELLARSLGSAHPDVGAAWATLGAILQGAGKLAEAREAYERALEVVEAAFGGEHPDVALVLANLSELERARGRPGSGRGAREPGAGPAPRGARGGAPARGDEPQQPGALARGPRRGWRRPPRCCARRGARLHGARRGRAPHGADPGGEPRRARGAAADRGGGGLSPWRPASTARCARCAPSARPGRSRPGARRRAARGLVRLVRAGARALLRRDRPRAARGERRGGAVRGALRGPHPARPRDPGAGRAPRRRVVRARRGSRAPRARRGPRAAAGARVAAGGAAARGPRRGRALRQPGRRGPRRAVGSARP